MGLLKPSSVLDICYAQVQQVQMGSNVVELNIRHIPVKSQDEVIAVGKKGINVFVSVHNFSLLVERSVRPSALPVVRRGSACTPLNEDETDLMLCSGHKYSGA